MTTIAEPRYTFHPSGMNLTDREIMLKALGERWDELIYKFDDGRAFVPHGYMTQDLLLAAAKRYTHPDLTDEDVALWMESLRDALSALRNFECDGIVPPNMEDEAYANRSTDGIVEVLLNDVDDAIAPLLHGTPHLCVKCRRLQPSVTHWHPAMEPTVWCAEHQR